MPRAEAAALFRPLCIQARRPARRKHAGKLRQELRFRFCLPPHRERGKRQSYEGRQRKDDF